MTSNIDLVRLSQEALPIARNFDVDNNKTLDATEFKNFMSVWEQNNKNKSPLLMQLHTNSLTEDAKKIAQECDTDEIKGVLTELELQAFMDKYGQSGLKKVFKDGVDLYEVLTGNRKDSYETNSQFSDKNNNIFNSLGVKWALFKNWLKLDIMNFRGTDKFFHAVGNFEAMLAGPEAEVKEVCAGQDEDKRNNMQRPEADYTEDLYANWLGREFAKIYPDANPNDLFKALAPSTFDTEESKKNILKLAFDTEKKENNWFSNKFKQYKNYFAEDFISKRFKNEMADLFQLN